MFVFLQNLRATLIPTIAVPVVLLGTFGVLAVAGLLDQHADHVRHGAGHRPAGRRCHRGGRKRRARHGRGGACRRARPPASRWTRSPARWSASRWCCRRCSCPMAFFSGSTGVIYRQFSITIVSAMVFVGAGRADPDAGLVRHRAQAGREGTSAASGAASSAGSTATFAGAVSATSTSGRGTESCRGTGRVMIIYRVVVADWRRCSMPPADVVPARRRPGPMLVTVHAPAGATQDAHGRRSQRQVE